MFFITAIAFGVILATDLSLFCEYTQPHQSLEKIVQRISKLSSRLIFQSSVLAFRLCVILYSPIIEAKEDYGMEKI